MEYIAGKPDLNAKNIAAFDLDDTVIKTKSGKRFQKDHTDWQFFNDKVQSKLTELHKTNHLIMIISNKRGIEKGKMTVTQFESKLNAIYIALNKLPFICLYATGDDVYRKPRIGLWENFLLSRPANPPDLSSSFYCGDAAGRPTDFADTDYKFALNAELPFKLPLQIFGSLSDKAVEILPVPTHPSSFLPTGNYDLAFLYDLTEHIVIVLTGSQASGKSTISSFLNREGYEIVSQDKLKTLAKTKKALKTHLTNGDNVVIDNTNSSKTNRKVWIDIAKEFATPHIVSIHLTADKHMSLHLNTYRNLYDMTRDPMKKRVPDVAIHSYFKRFEQPTKDEGFTHIFTLNFLLNAKKDNKNILKYMR